ncbi:MAG: hypothetical protein ACKOAP_10900 [Vulcanococcus sp.]
MPSLLYTPAVTPARRRPRRWALGAAAVLLLGNAVAPALAKIPILGDLLPAKPVVRKLGPTAPVVAGSMPEAQFLQLLNSSNLQALNLACREAVDFGFDQRLQLLQARLMTAAPAPQPLSVVLVNANALLTCLAPDGALAVLNRYGPRPGLEQEQWWLMRWRAARAGLHHAMAAEALERLAGGNLARLEALPLPLQLRKDGSLETLPGLDVYAEHLLVLGRDREAATVLLAGRMPGRVAAERLQRAVALLNTLPAPERDALLERALDQAAAAQAWGLALALLEDQRRLIETSGAQADRARGRLLVLSRRVDDAYSEWRLRGQDPQQVARSAELQQQLRSPRAPGGHAPSLP